MGTTSLDQAETLALRGLAWLLSDPDRTERFLALSGCDAETLRRRADDPTLLGAVLDALLEDEASLVAFAAWADLAPTAIARARRLLPGAMTELQAP